MDSKNLVLKPRISEKTYMLSANNVFVFDVPVSSNKNQVSAAVSAQYDVEVVEVNIAISKGKKVRQFRKRKYDNGQRSDYKKAYVKLAPGNSIPLFNAEDEDNKEAKKSETKDTAKKPAKTATKNEAKPVKEAPKGRLFRRNKEGER